jgi:hypothetical protein
MIFKNKRYGEFLVGENQSLARLLLHHVLNVDV